MHKNLPEVRGKYRSGVDLARICWFGVGGKAAIAFTPHDTEDLIFFLKNKGDLPIFVFGVGSNTLIRDGGFEGVVIRLGNSMNFMRRISNDAIEVGASSLDQNVAHFAKENSIGCLEFLSGIPGTIGGGLAMNAGAYGMEFSDIVVNVKALDLNGNLIELSKEEMRFKYRGNGVKDLIFLSTLLKGLPCDKDEIAAKINKIKEDRFNTQPVKGVRTGGSTFKNPEGLKAWKLIDEAGCRGLRVGGAQVSELHCNFIINTGSATAAEIEELIVELCDRVFQKTGVILEKELIIFGKKCV